MPQNVEACDWLAAALRGLEPPFLDAGYASLRAVRSQHLQLACLDPASFAFLIANLLK